VLESELAVMEGRADQLPARKNGNRTWAGLKKELRQDEARLN